MDDTFVVNSARFPGVFLRLDGTGVTAFAAAGAGTVNCQFGVGGFEKLKLVPQDDDTVAIGSVQFPGVFLRLDGSGISAFSPSGAGMVNCQFGVGPFEKFHIVPQSDGAVALASVQFPGVFLRLDGTGVGAFSADGSGTVNGQFGVGEFERLRILPATTQSDMTGVLNVFQRSAEISGPVCPNGGHVVCAVNVIGGAGRVVFAARAECTNSCVTDNLEPSVAIDIVDKDGAVVDSIALDIPVVPARGFNNATVRAVEASIAIGPVQARPGL